MTHPLVSILDIWIFRNRKRLLPKGWGILWSPMAVTGPELKECFVMQYTKRSTDEKYKLYSYLTVWEIVSDTQVHIPDHGTINAADPDFFEHLEERMKKTMVQLGYPKQLLAHQTIEISASSVRGGINRWFK